MKRRILFVVLISLACLHSQCQTTSSIRKIEFTSLTRGFHKNITITPDSAIFTVRGEPSKSYNRKLNKNEWASLTKTLETVKLSEIPELKSPTMKRAYDGALHSTITLIAPDGQMVTHSFDDEDPHDKLKPLLKKILAVEQRR